ncbi:hypothetical protein JHK85_006861 [Glycine max]|nr:hypothetical protein JHK85_006861 [Glycine max]
MGYQGDSITWRNGRMGVRLDKSLISLDWRLMFQDAMIVHLEWMKSGHMPPLLRKAYLKNELDKLDIRRGVGINPFLDSKYSSIWKEYEQVLAKEEVHWRNRYDMIKDGDGNWVVDPEKLEEMATKLYEDLYIEDFVYLPFVISHAFPK